jgi:hypothetical protein
MPNGALQLEGARELARALNKVDKGLRREVGAALRVGGEVVAVETRSLIRDGGHVASGAALNSVKVSVLSFTVLIRETANRDGFPYPRLRRFKALMESAREKSMPEVEVAVEKALDRLAEGQGLT